MKYLNQRIEASEREKEKMSIHSKASQEVKTFVAL